MGSITPILDTLLPQVLGRAGDVTRIGQRAANGPLSALRPISGDMSSPMRSGSPAYAAQKAAQGVVRGPIAANARAGASSADMSAPRGIAAAIAAGRGQGSPSSELHLSRGGGVLARLLAEVAASRDTLAITAGQPLASGANVPRPADLAGLLARQVSSSGLFYESHLAAWVRGQFPKSQLDKEPQAWLRRGEEGRESLRRTVGDAAAQSANPSATDPRLAALVRQQIELLASGVFRWQGEAWPETPMRWTVERDARQTHDDEQPQPVSTALSLKLVGIGAFQARLRVTGQSVSVATWVEPGAGRALVAADLETLRQRLRDAGFNEMSVHLVTERAT